MSQQVADCEFAAAPLGHRFELRPFLAKVSARRCALCSADVSHHSRGEVDERDLMLLLDATCDDKTSVILEGELMVGSFKAMIAHLTRDASSVAVNCAGRRSRSMFSVSHANIFDPKCNGRHPAALLPSEDASGGRCAAPS